MTRSIIAFPAKRPGGPAPKKRLDDCHVVPFDKQPDAITERGELWHLNALHMRQIIVLRPGVDGAFRHRDGKHQRAVGEFATVRDAAEAVQAHNILTAILKLDHSDLADYGFNVLKVLQEYGR